MVFLVENINTPEQRAEFTAFGFKRPGTNEPSDASDWIVDRERGIFIASLGGGAFGRPNFFEVVTREGVQASVEANLRAEGNAVPRGLEIWWSVSAIRIQGEAAGAVPEIRAWLIEALKEFGYFGETHLSRLVHVDFLATATAVAGGRS